MSGIACIITNNQHGGTQKIIKSRMFGLAWVEIEMLLPEVKYEERKIFSLCTSAHNLQPLVLFSLFSFRFSLFPYDVRYL